MTRWPTLMKRRTAAEYLDMSEAAFEREILAGRLPASFLIGGREHWRKDAIDAALDRLGGSATPSYRKELQERYGQAA